MKAKIIFILGGAKSGKSSFLLHKLSGFLLSLYSLPLTKYRADKV